MLQAVMATLRVQFFISVSSVANSACFYCSVSEQCCSVFVVKILASRINILKTITVDLNFNQNWSFNQFIDELEFLVSAL